LNRQRALFGRQQAPVFSDRRPHGRPFRRRHLAAGFIEPLAQEPFRRLVVEDQRAGGIDDEDRRRAKAFTTAPIRLGQQDQ
jgi:hypothetical protein